MSFINSILITLSHLSTFTQSVVFYLQRNKKDDLKTSRCIKNLVNKEIEISYSRNNRMTKGALQWCELFKLLFNDVKSETNPIE